MVMVKAFTSLKSTSTHTHKRNLNAPILPALSQLLTTYQNTHVPWAAVIMELEDSSDIQSG